MYGILSNQADFTENLSMQAPLIRFCEHEHVNTRLNFASKSRKANFFEQSNIVMTI